MAQQFTLTLPLERAKQNVIRADCGLLSAFYALSTGSASNAQGINVDQTHITFLQDCSQVTVHSLCPFTMNWTKL